MRRLFITWPCGLALLLTAAAGTRPAPVPAAAHGTVHVAYAGSLAYLNDRLLGPAFQRQSGMAYLGQGGGALGLAREVAAGGVQADVFESLGPAPLKALGSRDPGWAVAVATSPLVIAYSPTSPYAGALRRVATGHASLRRLLLILASPGFRLGRTNPETDPQGQAFILMIHLALRQAHLPQGLARRILGPPLNPAQLFAEEGILSELQVGALDASSAYLPEALQRHLPYIPLPPTLDFADPKWARLYASASVRLPSGGLVHGVPLAILVTLPRGGNAMAGRRFLSFMLSAEGRRLMREAGYPPALALVGSSRRAPAWLRQLVHR